MDRHGRSIRPLIDAYETLMSDATGEDVNHYEAGDEQSLHHTPARAAKAWREITSGYRTDLDALLTVFPNDEGYDQMVTVAGIPFYSTCEHHLLPIFGTADVSYVPKGRIVGLSKVNRVVDCFARRLQVQERLTKQVADYLQEALDPLGVGVRLRARHLCMEARGVCQQGHHTVTTALTGAYREPEVRAEFLRSCADGG